MHDSSYTRYSSLLLPHHLLLLIGLSCLSAVEGIYCVLFEEANCFFAVVLLGSCPPSPAPPQLIQLETERRHGPTRVPSLRDIAHDGVLCTCTNRLAPDRGKSGGPPWQAAWTVRHVQNHTLLGHSPPAIHAGHHVGPAL
jgi:hypothetical protein